MISTRTEAVSRCTCSSNITPNGTGDYTLNRSGLLSVVQPYWYQFPFLVLRLVFKATSLYDELIA